MAMSPELRDYLDMPRRLVEASPRRPLRRDSAEFVKVPNNIRWHIVPDEYTA
jgi:hypothetical protein